MTLHEIAQLRLINQRLINSPTSTPQATVEWMGAMQAQDYPGAKWSLGLRTPGATEANIEHAVAQGTIIRTWPMRGTLHFVPTKDAPWMLSATTARPLASAATRHKQLGLTSQVLQDGAQILVDTLRNSPTPVIRKNLMEALEKHGIATKEQRGYHIIWWAAQHGLLAVGPLHGKQPTFVALTTSQQPLLTTQEAIDRLAQRYFMSHGPASVKDFAWWSSLTVKDVRQAIERISNQLTCIVFDSTEYWLDKHSALTDQSSVLLLPGFDEYLLGYSDRSAALHRDHFTKIVPGSNGMFMPTIVIDGQVVGIWKRIIGAKKVTIQLMPFAAISASRNADLRAAAQRYGSYIGLPVDLQHTPS